MGPMIESRFRAALIAALSLVVATRVHAACSFSGASYSAGTAPHAVALADLNRDNRPDMVLANSGSNNITVRLGNGSGGFGTATLFTVGTAPVYVAAGDFNADGNRDLAVANRDSTNVSVLIGDGTGGFASAVSYAVFSQQIGRASCRERVEMSGGAGWL